MATRGKARQQQKAPVGPSANDVVLCTASYDHTVKFWEVHSGRSIKTIKHTESQVNCLSLGPTAHNLAVAGNPNIKLFDVESLNGAAVTSYEGHEGNVTQCGWNSKGRWLYSSGEDNTVKIWDHRAPGCQRQMDNDCAINTVVCHPNQVELIYGDQNGALKVWDLKTNTCSRALVPAGDTPIRSISISKNGKRVAAANNAGLCFVWRLNGNDTSSFDPLTKLEAHDNYITNVSISPDCKRMVTSSADHTCRVFDMKSFKKTAVLRGHEGWVWCVKWTLDSQFIVSCSSDSTAKLWDASNGEEMRSYSEHSKTVSAVSLSDLSE